MTDKVVDASAMAAVVFDEPDREPVEPRFTDAVLYVPTLFRFEMASVCLKKMRLRPDEQAEILAAFARSLLIAVIETEVDLTEAVTLATETRLSLYDASYLWLALNLGIELITLDEKLDKAHRKLARA